MNWKTYQELKEWGISEKLKECGGDVKETAKTMKVAEKTIYNVLGTKKIKKIRSTVERARE